MIENFTRFFVRPNEAIRTTEWKLIRTGTYEELYDVVADPYELTNLAFDSNYDGVRSSLRAELDNLLAGG